MVKFHPAKSFQNRVDIPLKLILRFEASDVIYNKWNDLGGRFIDIDNLVSIIIGKFSL